jgi:hypothetical protein
MSTLTSNLTAIENGNVAYNNSWIKIDNNLNRPLFAQASYLTNASDISISAGNINIDLSTLETLQQTNNSLLTNITSADINVPGFKIPPYDEINMDYVGSTNNLNIVTYKNNSTIVMTLSFAYVIQPPTENDAMLKTIKKI